VQKELKIDILPILLYAVAMYGFNFLIVKSYLLRVEMSMQYEEPDGKH